MSWAPWLAQLGFCLCKEIQQQPGGMLLTSEPNLKSRLTESCCISQSRVHLPDGAQYKSRRSTSRSCNFPLGQLQLSGTQGSFRTPAAEIIQLWRCACADTTLAVCPMWPDQPLDEHLGQARVIRRAHSLHVLGCCVPVGEHI